jgi:hypothetical protein
MQTSSELVKMMKPKDAVITFNYDCLIDETLQKYGDGKWNARYGYGLNLGKGRANLDGYNKWTPSTPGAKDKTISLYKLHGSLHFLVEGEKGEKVKLKRRPYTKQHGNLRFTIIPPESIKRYDESGEIAINPAPCSRSMLCTRLGIP